MLLHAFLLTLFCLVCLCPSCQAQPRDFESELIQYLKNNITNYSPLMRPLLNGSRPVYVTMDTAISQLVSVDTARQSIKVAAFVRAFWTEERLVWNTRDFDNIGVVNWDASQIWFPVMMVYNGIGDKQILTAQSQVYLENMGPNATQVTALWRREFEFWCELDASLFPVDRHECQLDMFFSDQGHRNTLVLPVKNTKDKYAFKIDGLFKQSSEWIVTNMTAWTERRASDILQGVNKTDVLQPTYVIHLEISRVPNYYYMIIITPLLLLTILQVMVYFVPDACGEKLGFGITITLSYTVFLLLLNGILPKTVYMPTIAIFITAGMILSTVTLVFSTIIMRLNSINLDTQVQRSTRGVFVQLLGRLFRLDGSSSKSASVDDTAIDAHTRLPSGEWMMAAAGIERLMMAVGIAATAVIISVFIVCPYA